MSGPMRTWATVSDGVMSETPHGGQTIDWEQIGQVWLKLGARRRRERVEAGRLRVLETATAETWMDHRLTPGRRLGFEDADWSVVAVETIGGRMILSLERTS